MPAFDPSVWSRLDASRAWGERLVAFRGTGECSDAVLAAIDSGGHRHILVRLGDRSLSLDDRSTRGLEVSTRMLVLDGGTTDRFIDLRCMEVDGHAVFDRMGGDIADRLGSGATQPASVVRDVLESWRRFWSSAPSSALNTSEQIGLFGELWFLYSWMSSAIGLDASVIAWRGPRGARNDFELPKVAWEVKTTISASASVHQVAGLDQLDCAPDSELFMLSLRLREDAGASNSLPSLIKLIREALDRSRGPMAHFEETLRSARYSSAHEEYYDRTFRVASECLYPVSAQFPRIVPSSFGGAPPAGVCSVAYEIDLGGFGNQIVCRSATDFARLVSDRWPDMRAGVRRDA
jgi:hypothetical protein